jgi:hypothetical protein
MYAKRILAIAALTTALLAPASAQAGRTVQGTANQAQMDITTSTGNANRDDPTIVNHLVGLISRAAPGSTIITNVFRTEANNDVVTALYLAKQINNVNVYVTYGDSDTQFDWVNQGTPNGAVRMHKCPLGCHNTSKSDGKAHSKYFLFDNTTRASGATSGAALWISSANLNQGSGSKASNFATTLYHDSDIWWGMWSVWMDAFNRDPNDGDYYRPQLGWNQPHSGIVYSAKSASVAHISPDRDGGDMWAAQLSPLAAQPGCIVRVMQAQITDERLDAVNQVRRLANGGCAVRVLLGTKDDGSADIGTQARALLCNAPNTLMKKRARLHDKEVEIYGTYEGTGGRVQVFSGSHNWTGNALRYNDEVLLRVSDSQSAYDALYDHFYDVWNNTTDSSSLAGCA